MTRRGESICRRKTKNKLFLQHRKRYGGWLMPPRKMRVADRATKIEKIESPCGNRGSSLETAAPTAGRRQRPFWFCIPGAWRKADGSRLLPCIHFGRIASHAGQPKVRFHDLRHFFAPMLIAQGESAKYVRSQMGQSSIQVTSSRTHAHQQERSCNMPFSQGEKMGLVAVW